MLSPPFSVEENGSRVADRYPRPRKLVRFFGGGLLCSNSSLERSGQSET